LLWVLRASEQIYSFWGWSHHQLLHRENIVMVIPYIDLFSLP
jgi:hypothetical protein